MLLICSAVESGIGEDQTVKTERCFELGFDCGGFKRIPCRSRSEPKLAPGLAGVREAVIYVPRKRTY